MLYQKIDENQMLIQQLQRADTSQNNTLLITQLLSMAQTMQPL